MQTIIVWLRQDLRLADNPALWHATQEADYVIPLYIYDDSTAWSLGGAQQWWLHHSLTSLKNSFAKHHIPLILKNGSAEKVLSSLIKKHHVDGVYWNRCYEPHAIARDTKLKTSLQEQGIVVKSFNGSLLSEPWQIKNKQGNAFKVFTPYWKHCLQEFIPRECFPAPSFKEIPFELSSENLESWDLLPTKPDWSKGIADTWQPGEAQAQSLLQDFLDNQVKVYLEQRDRLDVLATSHLSPYLHFGEISAMQIWQACLAQEAIHSKLSKNIHGFIREIYWREFSYYLLYHHPKLPEQNFNDKFDGFKWETNKKLLNAWQKGQSGYPIVDAGMRELWHTGYMHNRVRMVAASFLIKHLLIDWREGEAWFWDTLVDADLANNAASWQWVAGSGADAAPYFRIFNPILQGEKFDPEGAYVRHWVPELKKLSNKFIHHPWDASSLELEQAGIILGKNYPKPIVEHATARAEAMARYKALT